MSVRNGLSAGFYSCEDPNLRAIWRLYSETEKAPTITDIIGDEHWNDTRSYLAIAEQLIAMAWRLA